MRFLYLKLPERRADFAESCLALTPKVYAVGAHLYLGISATENYFGGLEGWLNRFESIRALYENEFPIEGVVVDRPEWGAALSPGAKRLLVLPAGQSQAILFTKNLPALLLCGDPATFEPERRDREKLIAFLKRLGLYTVGDFARLPPETIVRRFGKAVGHLHQWAHGSRPLALPAFEPDNRLIEKVDAEEAPHREGLLYLMQGTFTKMEARLLGRAALAKKLTFTFKLESGARKKELFLSEATRSSSALAKLFAEWVEGIAWDSPLQKVGVEVSDTIPQGSRQLHLFDDDETRANDLQNYLERLRHRLGDGRAGFIRLKENHLPEKTWEMVATPVPPEKPREFYPPRPLYLYTPQPFTFNADLWRLVPTEKLTTGWWSGEAPRQYFLAHGPNEKRLWIFQREEQWFLHGEFC